MDCVSFTVFDLDVDVFEADVGALRDLFVGVEVGLEVGFGGGEAMFVVVFEGEGVFAGDVEEDGGALEGFSVDLSLDVGVDEGGDV